MARRNLWVPLLLAVPVLFAAAPSASAQAVPTISVAPTEPTAGVQAQVTVTCDAPPAGAISFGFAVFITGGTAVPPDYTRTTLSSTDGVTFDAAGTYTINVSCLYAGGGAAQQDNTLDVVVQAPPTDTTTPTSETTTPTTGSTIAGPSTSSASGVVTVPASAATTSAAVAADSGLPPTGSSGTEWGVVAALTVVALGAVVVVGAGVGRRSERR